MTAGTRLSIHLLTLIPPLGLLSSALSLLYRLHFIHIWLLQLWPVDKLWFSRFSHLSFCGLLTH